MNLPNLHGPHHFLDLVSTAALRLYQADSLDAILQNTVEDVYRLLEVDRVLIYQLDSCAQAQSVASRENSVLPSLEDKAVDLSQCLERWLEDATLQQPKAVDNLATADLTPCEHAILSALGIEASVLVPIYLSLDWQQTSQWQDDMDSKLEVWGFLVAQQSRPRHWSPLELSFLRQLTQHLFHAIQQIQLRQFSERLIESAVDGIIALDTNYRYQVWNRPMEKLSGLSRQAVIGQVAWEIFPFLKESGEDKLIAMAMTGHSVVAQNRAFAVSESGGRKGVFEARYSPLTDPSGKVLGCLGVVRDITEQKQADLQLRKTTSRLTTLIQNLESGILVEDESRRILLANSKFCDIFRLPLSPEALRGPDCESLLRQVAAQFQDSATVIQGIDQILQRRQSVINQEVQLVDGRTLERDYIPIFIGTDYQGHLWQYRDITDRKRVQLQLEQAIRSAEAANSAKSNFLATMSHEIRTPLNAILGLTDLLRLTQLDAEQADFVETIHNSGSMLLALINDILDFSKIEADKLELEHRSLNLYRCVKDVVNVITPLAEDKGIAVTFHIAPEVPQRVIGDVTRLRQVLLNLVSNGVKFTRRGSVSIAVTAEPGVDAGGNRVDLHFAVHDTGIGIPDEARDALFEAFSQLDASVNRCYGGTGLGLAICKKLVEAMGGTIGFTTHAGVGTTFYFTIKAPLVPPCQHPQPEAQCVSMPDPEQKQGWGESIPNLGQHLPLKILVVDDLAVNQKVAVKMLQRLGYAPDYVKDGITAIDHVKQQPYDVVLMDVQMPGMDGYETTELIRRLPLTTAETLWIVAMTAHSNQRDHQQSLRSGMNDFLSKPVLLDSLVDCLVRYGKAHHPDKMVLLSQTLTPTSAPMVSTPAPLLDREILDGIRTMAGTDADTLLLELIDNFREDANHTLKQLHRAIQHREGNTIRQQAHALRSMSLNLGALALGNLCQDLELHHHKLSPSDQQTTLAAIEHLYAEVMVALKSHISMNSHP
jgi:PAS domain S-box-containing protein